MKKLAITFLLGLGSVAAQAAPQGNDIDNFLNERASMVNQFGQNVRDTASDLVSTAMGFIGVPYRYGGNSAETGFDCSGLVRATYEKTFGKILPRRAADQAAATQVIARSDLRPGDLVFFNTLKRRHSHMGIYIGDGRFVHAPNSRGRVRVERLANRYFAQRIDGARTLLASN